MRMRKIKCRLWFRMATGNTMLGVSVCEMLLKEGCELDLRLCDIIFTRSVIAGGAQVMVQKDACSGFNWSNAASDY